MGQIMKRVKLINDPAELVALFRAVDSEIRRNVLSTLAEDWTMISDLINKYGEESADIIAYFEKFKLICRGVWVQSWSEGSPIKLFQCENISTTLFGLVGYVFNKESLP